VEGLRKLFRDGGRPRQIGQHRAVQAVFAVAARGQRLHRLRHRLQFSDFRLQSGSVGVRQRLDLGARTVWLSAIANFAKSACTDYLIVQVADHVRVGGPGLPSATGNGLATVESAIVLKEQP
jgi:hypothetical protein